VNPVIRLAAAATPKPSIHVSIAPNVPNPAANTVALPPPAPMPQTWFQAHASWATHTVAGLFLIFAIALVVLLAVQTTKQEGLSGSIGGRVESAYHGRLGAEEQLQRITGFVAVGFVVTAFILSLTGI
jgi:preprotein translocase subunit SecG